MPSMSTKRADFSSLSFHRSIWAIGGFDGTQALSSVEVFSLSEKVEKSIKFTRSKKFTCFGSK